MIQEVLDCFHLDFQTERFHVNLFEALGIEEDLKALLFVPVANSFPPLGLGGGLDGLGPDIPLEALVGEEGDLQYFFGAGLEGDFFVLVVEDEGGITINLSNLFDELLKIFLELIVLTENPNAHSKAGVLHLFCSLVLPDLVHVLRAFR